MSNSTISGNSNIVIQDISNGNITLNVNGEVLEIQNQLAELKELLKNQKTSSITYESKVYNIEHINEANFGVVTSHKVFNGVLTKELILNLSEKEKVKNFLINLPSEDKDNWEGVRQHLKEAQGILEDSFVWVIGWELRRLFSIGNDKEKRIETKVEEYINHCFSTYRVSLQMLNFIFISKLWDEKIKNKDIDTQKAAITNFFRSKRQLKLAELRSLFHTLLDIFINNKFEMPIEELNIDKINEFLKPDSKFNLACIELEKLESIDGGTEEYGLGHCHTAEIALTTVLVNFNFFTNYQLVTLKKIEYEEARNSKARYIKDFNILEKKEATNQKRILKYDNRPGITYSVFFQNKNRAINLFPFLLDYNALTNENDFQIYFYLFNENDSDLRYFSLKSENEETISYLATASESMEVKSDELRNEFQKNIRLDLVAKQFEEAMNTILEINISFKPKGSNQLVDNLGNL
jgi:hypothetical protein